MGALYQASPWIIVLKIIRSANYNMTAETRYLAFSEAVESRQPDEEELGRKIVESMARVSRQVYERHQHALRDAHAKSHGLLKGTLEVYGNLLRPLAQGLFRVPQRYDVLVRLSTAPGDIHSDSVPAPRGFAIKVIGVEGRKILAEMEDALTQDFLLVNQPVIPFGHVAAYWETQQILERTFGTPDAVLRTAALLARGADKVLDAVGIESPLVEPLGMPNHHLLGETFYSMAALRYGDYVAKICVAPYSASVRKLTGQPINGDYSVLRTMVSDFFNRDGAEYELKAQLCTDLQNMPVEDASVKWPEEISPYQPIARLTFPPQRSDSPARLVFADEVLSFNPWHSLPEHRPLGSIMRVRIKAYEASTAFRHTMNDRPRIEPRTIAEIPD